MSTSTSFTLKRKVDQGSRRWMPVSGDAPRALPAVAGRACSSSESGAHLVAVGPLKNDPSVEGASWTSARGNNTRKQIEFNQFGKLVGENTASFSTFLRQLTRAHCSITYTNWRSVPAAVKYKIWSMVLGTYDIEEKHKQKVLKKVNRIWRSWKYKLRKRNDMYDRDAERERHSPNCVNEVEWNGFADLESMEQSKTRREKEKASGREVECPLTIGRRGAARTQNENPDMVDSPQVGESSCSSSERIDFNSMPQSLEDLEALHYSLVQTLKADSMVLEPPTSDSHSDQQSELEYLKKEIETMLTSDLTDLVVNGRLETLITLLDKLDSLGTFDAGLFAQINSLRQILMNARSYKEAKDEVDQAESSIMPLQQLMLTATASFKHLGAQFHQVKDLSTVKSSTTAEKESIQMQIEELKKRLEELTKRLEVMEASEKEKEQDLKAAYAAYHFSYAKISKSKDKVASTKQEVARLQELMKMASGRMKILAERFNDFKNFKF